MKYKYRAACLAAAVTLVSLSERALAATIIVTPTTIVAAFNAASAGDTLRLIGNFGLTRLQGRSFTHTLTLDATRAHFTDTLNLTRDGNVRVYGGKWDVTGGTAYSRAVIVIGGDRIAIDHSSVVGNASQQGVSFTGTTRAEISYGTFEGLHTGIAFTGVVNGTATRNTVVHAEGDGIDIGDSHFVTASGNGCTLSAPGAGVHPDCIQLWSVAGHALQSDIVVTRNTVSGMTQGFTSFSGGGGGVRLQITHNRINTSLPQGVACYGCIDSIITDNYLQTLTGSAHVTNLYVIGGTNNIVSRNRVVPFKPSRAPQGVGAIADATFDAAPVAAGSAATVPEPAAWGLMIVGFGAVGTMRRAARRTAAPA